MQYVIHYDIARSPQIYLHRSGRTARANNKGITLSLVSPLDVKYHESISTSPGVQNDIKSLAIDADILEELREKVLLARKVCCYMCLCNY